MATGTGLPKIASDAPVLAQAAGGVSGDALYNAQAWTNIANSGEKLAKAGGDYLKVSEHKAQVGYLADQDVDIQRNQIEMRNKFANDPKGFDAEWKGYADGKLSTAEPWAVNHVRASLGSTGNTAYSAILNETRVETEANAKKSWGSLEDMASNDVNGHAMAGTLSTPTGQLAVDKYRGVIATGVTSQFIPRDTADQRLATLESTATVYASRAHIKSTFDNQGEGPSGAIGAINEIDGITRDPKLQLSPEQRISLGARLRADVHGWDAERTQNVSTVDLQAKALLQSKQGGLTVPQSMIDDVVGRYTRFGAPANAASFLSDLQHSESLSFIPRMSVSQSGEYLNQLKTNYGFNSPPQAAKTAMDYFQSQGYSKEQSAGIVGNLVHESGLNPNAVHDQGTGLGIAGHRLERLDAMKSYAASVGKPVNDFQTQLEFINKELQGSESAAGAKVRAATTPEQAAAAFINFERPQGYDPANISASHGYANRVGQAVSLAGGTMPTPSTSNITYIGKAQQAVGKKVSDDADLIIKDMQNNVLPTQERINDLLSTASATNTPEVLDKVAKAAGEYQYRRDFGRAPPAEQAAAMGELQYKANTEGLSTTKARELEIGNQVLDQTKKALEADPLAHTMSALAETSGMKPPAPLNIGNSPQFQAGMMARSQWAATGTATYQTAPMPALTTAEAGQVRAALDAADPAGKARIYSDIVQSTSGPTRAATLAKLGAKGVDGMVEAYAGAMTGVEPAIGESIIRGQAAMKGKDTFNPEKSKNDVAGALSKYLPTGAFSLAALTDPQGQYSVMRGAVLARAADLAASDPNFKGEFPDQMIQHAVNDVTGGVVTHNGGSIITPIRGMNQRGFDAKIAGLTDRDLQGVQTLNGTPLTADYVRNNAQLESRSDGTYRIRLGREPGMPVYAFRDLGVMGQPMKPFVLDLRGIAPVNFHANAQDRFDASMAVTQ